MSVFRRPDSARLEEFYGKSIASTIAVPLPDGYVPYRACKEYFVRESSVLKDTTPVAGGVTWGVAWSHGPLRFEKFMSDEEPSGNRSGRLRLTIWQRLSRRDVPRGWWRAPEDMGLRMTGIADVADGEYERRWTSHARRHLSRWRKLVASGTREVVALDLAGYLDAYARADQDAFMKIAYPKVVREKAAAHGNRMRFLGSRRPGGTIDAGLAYLHVPEVATSVHVAAFIGGDAKDDAAGTGLVARWFEDCRTDGMRFLDFGFFWAPGDPRDWKGFSRFKCQFGTRLLRFPRPLMRLSGRWGGE